MLIAYSTSSKKVRTRYFSNTDTSARLPTGGFVAYTLLSHKRVYTLFKETEGGAPELLQHLAQVYIGPGTKYPPMDNPPAGYITRIAPEHVYDIGPWQS